MRLGKWAGWTLALLLTACQHLPQHPPPNDLGVDAASHRSGRLSVRVEGNAARSFSADFELDGGPAVGRLTLSTPLGTRLAQAQWQPGRAWLTSSDGVREFADLDGLAEQTLGERVPLVALFDWLAGRPSAAAPSTALPSPGQGFEQLGWQVQLDKWREGLMVATRLASPTVTVRAKLDEPPANSPFANP